MKENTPAASINAKYALLALSTFSAGSLETASTHPKVTHTAPIRATAARASDTVKQVFTHFTSLHLIIVYTEKAPMPRISRAEIIDTIVDLTH
jgi:hypothetical protein